MRASPDEGQNDVIWSPLHTHIDMALQDVDKVEAVIADMRRVMDANEVRSDLRCRVTWQGSWQRNTA